MATEAEIAQAHHNLEKEYKDVMQSLGDLYVAIEALKSAGIGDEISDLLDRVQSEAKKARTGGVIGSGAKGHSKALKEYRELTTPKEP